MSSEQLHYYSLPFPSPACTENPTKRKVLKCILILATPALGGSLKVSPNHAEKTIIFKNSRSVSELNERFFV